MQEKEKKLLRTRIYIDGYNLYYGCLRNTPYKWLDICTLFEKYILPSVVYTLDGEPTSTQLLPEAINYFTAKILEQAAKADDSVSCQAKYHSALTKQYNGRIRMIEGYYSLVHAKAKIVDAEDPYKWPKFCQGISVWKLEEKQSDVNLALRAYHDSITGAVDQVVIVTNDTDIAPALALIREHTKVIVGVVVPRRNSERPSNADLSNLAHWTRSHITEQELAKSQLPRVIPGRKPTSKPESWYPNQEVFQQILILGISVLGKKNNVFRWMDQVNEHLGNQKPIDMIETLDGANQVLKYMQTYIAENTKGLAED